ncbi:Glucan endo-1,3-beta-glucosidase 1 [Morus notabilis]|uniref:glucan endo-1,3-beta-D-glucosidase n=1 Tax=Morus notabilis TaxID=981085 RepID=W9RS80_9ROSA|nr:Glucan endo-1,3-beta-glucosidase 1 [Morus notabilis]
MLKLKMVLLIFQIFFLSFLGLTVAGQESIQLFNLYTATSEAPQASTYSGLAVSVSTRDLREVSRSVLMAESWLRTYVLAHYPATGIATIVVGNNLLCEKDQELNNLSMVLPSLKNIRHSLTRWGLEKDIKVSASISSSCLNPHSTYFNGDFAHKFTKPVLEFLQTANSTYSVNPPPKFSPLPDETMRLVSSHSECMKKLGFSELNKINVILTNPKESNYSSHNKLMSRKLTSLNNPNLDDPLPTRPNDPLPKTADPPLHSSVGFSVPSNAAKHPQPPQAQLTYPPKKIAPVVYPASPPYSYALPPCNPSHAHPVSPPPNNGHGIIHKLWCVAKPTVPADTLQAALDYACGDGGADCNEITPHGNCYTPDSVVAHASYAFNSYWQKNKRNGGTCSFGGTAMLSSLSVCSHLKIAMDWKLRVWRHFYELFCSFDPLVRSG